MSRVGLKPIPVPAGVTVTVSPENQVSVKGPKGELRVDVYPELSINVGEGEITIARSSNERVARSQHGLARTLIGNCVQGVTTGHTRQLEIQGVGFRAQLEGKNLVLSVGYSHPVKIEAVPGVDFELAQEERSRTQKIVVSGIDKQKVGQVAADIRKVRRPDPYKGKGIRYVGEVVKLKAGKRAASAKK